jgi:hypothetical protein
MGFLDTKNAIAVHKNAICFNSKLVDSVCPQERCLIGPRNNSKQTDHERRGMD